MSATDIVENAILRHFFRNTAFSISVPATVYVALFTTMPADDGTGGVEVSGGSYVRQGVTTGTSGTGSGSGWTDPSGGNGQSTNVADVVFPTATGSWGTVLGIGIYDAVSAGNAFYLGTGTATAIGINVQFKILAGTLSITVT